VHPEALRTWVRQERADRGERRDLLTSDERQRLKSWSARIPRPGIA
jgi:hypothetical protein